jgi:hypothetical protein
MLIELTTEEQYKKYINGIKEVEKLSKDKLKQFDYEYIYFATGEDVLKYILSDKANVYVYLENEKVVSLFYIKNIDFSEDFTYDDLGKFFRCNDEFNLYVKKRYKNEYKNNLKKIYEKNIENFNEILKEKKYDLKIFNENFDETNKIRKEIIKKMNEKTKLENLVKLNRDFFYLDSNELKKNNIEINKKDEIIKIYDEYLKKSKFLINFKSENFNIENYFECNVENFIELDTFVTHPDFRKKGLTKKLIFNGIKKTLNKYFNEKNIEILFFVLTVHDDNFISKKICNFFEIYDFVNIERKKDIYRNVYIKKIKKNEYENYLKKIEKKMIFFGFENNDKNILITNEEKILFKKEKIENEKKLKNEIENKIKNCNNEKHKNFFKIYKNFN